MHVPPCSPQSSSLGECNRYAMWMPKQPYGEVHMVRNLGLLQTASKQLRTPIQSPGSELPCDAPGLAKPSDDCTLAEM